MTSDAKAVVFIFLFAISFVGFIHFIDRDSSELSINEICEEIKEFHINEKPRSAINHSSIPKSLKKITIYCE